MNKYFFTDRNTFFNAFFNLPQSLTMTLSVSFYQGIFDWHSLLQTWVCAYCAGVMLTAFLKVGEAGQWVAGRFRAGGIAAFLLANTTAGIIMGFLMNFFMTFMMLGPVAYFGMAYLHTLGISLAASVIAANIWTAFTLALMKKVYNVK